MASIMDGGSPESSAHGSEKRQFRKYFTLNIDVVDNTKIKASSVFETIERLCGVSTILACVPRSGNTYDVTLDGRSPMPLLLDGVEINCNIYGCHAGY